MPPREPAKRGEAMSLQSLYDALRYQVNIPAITTCGPCDQPRCAHYARGSATCKHCLSGQIDAILDNRMASKWVMQQGEANRTRWILEMAIEEARR